MAGHRGDHGPVLDGLTHEAGRVRTVALGAAQRLGILDPERLGPALADPDPEVRRRATELAAASEHGDAVAPTIVALLDDPEVAEVAAFALGEIDERGLSEPSRSAALAALADQATGHDDALCRESAVAALGAMGEGLATILAASGDVATVRRRAVLALAPFEGPEVDEALHRALSDRDWQVRQAAEDLLGHEPTDSPAGDQPTDDQPTG